MPASRSPDRLLFDVEKPAQQPARRQAWRPHIGLILLRSTADKIFVSTTSSVVSNLLQTLSADSPALSTAFSSPNVQSALQNASPTDIVQLSDDAVQFQEASLLFGDAGSTSTPTAETASDTILQSMESALQTQASAANPTSTASSTPTSTPDLASLFGTTTTPSLSTYI
jgi:hypothetical protein